MGKKLTLTLTLVALSGISTSGIAQDVQVQGYTRSNGAYVAPHYRSAPDSSTYNNYGSRRNSGTNNGTAGTGRPSYGSNNPNYNARNNNGHSGAVIHSDGAFQYQRR